MMRSDDKRFVLKITGQIQTDYKNFVDPGDATDFNNFLVRRARLGIEATVAQYYEFRLLPDFGLGVATIQDAFLNVHYWDQLQIEAGRFKQPFSYEQLIQDRFVPTLERSLIDQLVPARDVGVMIHGQKLLGDRFDYGVSYSDGTINGNTDVNNSKDVTGRVAFRPLNSEALPPWLRLLQMGMSFNTGADFEAANPAVLKTPAGVPWFTFATGVKQGIWHYRYSPELSYFFGPFGFAGQYLFEDQGYFSAAGVPVRVPESGYYLLATLLLTGESRTTYSQAVVPGQDFDLRHPLASPGAWELVARMSRLEQSTIIFAPGAPRLADPAANSAGATEMTLGFNWYINAWVRVQFNWERAWFNQPVRLSPPTGSLSNQDSLLMRFQVIF